MQKLLEGRYIAEASRRPAREMPLKVCEPWDFQLSRFSSFYYSIRKKWGPKMICKMMLQCRHLYFSWIPFETVSTGI